MAFCKNCGKQINNGVSFCPSCGTKTGFEPAQNQGYQPNQFQQNQYRANQFQQPQFQQNAYMPQAIPGRAQGITAMILGIIGLVYAFYIAYVVLLVSDFFGGYFVDELIPSILFFSVLSITAVVLGVMSKGKGYVCGISSSAVIMGAIGTVVYVIALFVCLAS